MARMTGPTVTSTYLMMDKTLKRLVTLGSYLQPWQTVDCEENRSIGRFEGDRV